MIYSHLFQPFLEKGREVQAAVIGAGHFGTAVVTQQNQTPMLRVSVVADKDPERAKSAFVKADIPEEHIVYSADAAEAAALIRDGRYIYTDDPMIIMDIPGIEVV